MDVCGACVRIEQYLLFGKRLQGEEWPNVAHSSMLAVIKNYIYSLYYIIIVIITMDIVNM